MPIMSSVSHIYIDTKRKISGPSWAYRYIFHPKKIAKLIRDKIEPIKGISYKEFEESFLKSI
jgi:hypothetical protein